MSLAKRLGAALNIAPGEGRLVVLMFTLSFFSGIAIVVGFSAIMALFLTVLGAEKLPYVYIIAAGILIAVGSGFSYTQARLSLGYLLIAIWSGVLLSIILFYAGLNLWGNLAWLVFGLMIWTFFVQILVALSFWTLAGKLYNLDQGKRLFGMIGSGELVSRAVGYLGVGLIVNRIGTVNVLLVVVVSVAACLILLIVITRQQASELATTVTKQSLMPEHTETIGSQKLFKQRYVILILAATLIAGVIYVFLGFVFSVQAEQQIPDVDQLTSFFGIFFGASYVGAVILSGFGSGYALRRYGVRSVLFSSTLVVCIGMIGTLSLGLLGFAMSVVFSVIAATRFLDAISRRALYRNAFQLLYQPLPMQQRLPVVALAQSVSEPLALAITGGILLVSRVFGELAIVPLSAILLVLSLIWVGLVLLINREYAVALGRALSRRVLQGSTLQLDDAASLLVVEQTLDSPRAGEVVYALNLLAQTRPEVLVARLPTLLRHPDLTVRREALSRIEHLRLTAALPTVRRMLDDETDVSLRAAALQAMCVLIEDDTTTQIGPYLGDPDPALRQGAMVGLLRYGGISGILHAGQMVLQMAEANEPEERVQAARVLGKVGASDFYQPLVPLLHDDNDIVRRAALAAAGQLKHPRLWPVVLEAMAFPATHGAAAHALVAGDAAAVPAIEDALHSPTIDRRMRERLAQVSGRIGGNAAITLLRAGLEMPDDGVRHACIEGLARCGYQASDAEAEVLRDYVRSEASYAAWTLAALVDIGDRAAVALLREALLMHLDRQRARILTLLGFLGDPHLRTVQTSIEHRSEVQRAYAQELLEVQLDPKDKPFVLPLVGELSPSIRLQRMQDVSPQELLGLSARLRAIITGPEVHLTPWLRACALHAVGEMRVQELRKTVQVAGTTANELVREMAAWAEVRLHRGELVAVEQADSDQAAIISDTVLQGRRGVTMLSTLEKVIILKTVDLFATTPDDVLAEVAGRLAEVAVSASESIFAKGDHGESMYIIVAGEVRVHDNGQTLNHLGEREIFGEMALLDPEPRIASVTAVTDTLLLRLDQAPFYELMDDRSEIARNVIRVLTRHLRARVRDLHAARTDPTHG